MIVRLLTITKRMVDRSFMPILARALLSDSRDAWMTADAPLATSARTGHTNAPTPNSAGLAMQTMPSAAIPAIAMILRTALRL